MRQNLLDAGIPADEAEKIISLHTDGHQAALLGRLRMQKAVLLDNLHNSQRKIDRLDYLIRQVEREG